MRFHPLVAVHTMFVVLASAPAARAGTLSFTDIWSANGLPGTNGGHGVQCADVDADGDPDLYLPLNFTPQLRPDLFLRNDGGTQFVSDGVTHGIDDYDEGSHGGAWADLDHDGDYDLINGTTYGATAWNDIFENDGTGTFTDVTPVSVQARTELTRALITFDLDGDGDLDLYGVTNSKGTNDPAAERNEVWRNDGNFQFTAVDSGDLYVAPAGQGATDTDFDGDGDVDVLACNRTGAFHVLRNEGGGTFVRIAPATWGITDWAPDGITTADIDNDDDLDLLLAGDDVGHLYRNDGATFAHLTTFSGTDGYMGGFADLDNDGDLDLVFAGDDVVMLNDGGGTFTTGPTVPVGPLTDPRGISFADLDDDGDLDFGLGVKNSRSALIRNDFDGGNWIKVRLVSPQGQAGAFGSKTRIYPAGQAGGLLLGLRESRSNYGYLGQDDPVLHFGLGAHAAVDVVVTFADGTVVTVPAATAKQTLLVDGSAGPPVAVRLPAGAVRLNAQLRPNPFRVATALSWSLEREGQVGLTVYDAGGRRVRTLVEGRRSAGSHSVVWNGRDGAGRRVPAGVYFYRLEANGGRESGTITRLR